MAFELFPEQEDFGEPVGASKADRFPEDRRLRLHGFRVEHRRPGEEPVWSRREGGKRVEYPQSKALDLIGLEQKAAGEAFAEAGCEGK